MTVPGEKAQILKGTAHRVMEELRREGLAHWGLPPREGWAWDFTMTFGRCFLGTHVSVEKTTDMARGDWTMLSDHVYVRTGTGALWAVLDVGSTWGLPCAIIVLAASTRDDLPDVVASEASKLVVAGLINPAALVSGEG